MRAIYDICHRSRTPTHSWLFRHPCPPPVPTHQNSPKYETSLQTPPSRTGLRTPTRLASPRSWFLALAALRAQHCLSHDARSQLRPVARRSARSCQLFRPRFRSVGPALAAMRLLLLASGVPKLCLRFAARAMSLTTVHCVCRLTSRRMIAGTGLFMNARSQCREHDCRRRASCRAPSQHPAQQAASAGDHDGEAGGSCAPGNVRS